MTTMIERVARAIYEKRNGAGCRPWIIQPKARKFAYQVSYIDDARAAIEAMREPTDLMVQLGLGWREFDIPDHWPNEARVPYGTWRAMIDAALAEEKQG